MTQQYQITLDVDVYDKAKLREAAKAEALKTMSAEDWEDLRASNLDGIAADIHMLLDPGVSPDGCEIENGEVTYVGSYGDDKDEDDEPEFEQGEDQSEGDLDAERGA
jgi:hypothetical protein